MRATQNSRRSLRPAGCTILDSRYKEVHGRPWRREQGTRFEFELAEAQGSVEDLQAAQLMDTATTARQDESGGGDQ